MSGRFIFALSVLIALSGPSQGMPTLTRVTCHSRIRNRDWNRPTVKNGVDVFWLDEYGNISWEDEKARLDNFAIQLMNDPKQLGYYYVVVGKKSCRGEAQARAVRAKDYLTRVRAVDWARIIWRDIGYGDDFQVSIWLAPRGKPPMYFPQYQRATRNHVIENCGVNPLDRRKLNSRRSAARYRLRSEKFVGEDRPQSKTANSIFESAFRLVLVNDKQAC